MTKFENETGRSMVEMLGVLAIIGVLSVGGVAGYTTAMNKHRANELLQQASLRAVVVSTQLQMGIVPPTLGEFTQNKFSGGTFSTEVTVNVKRNLFTFTLNEVPSAVCNQMMQMRPGNMLMSDCSDSGEVALSLSYDTLLNTPNTPDKCAGVDVGECGVCDPETGEVSDDNSKCPSGGACSNKVCQCQKDVCDAYCKTVPYASETWLYSMGNCSGTDTSSYCYNYAACIHKDSSGQCISYCCCDLCLTGETMITLSDGTCKRLDQVMPGDRVLCLNPETGALDIDEVVESDALEHKEHTEYDIWTFSDQTVVKTVYRHRFYNLDQQRMAYMDEWKMGEHAYTRSGKKVALVHHERVQEKVRHYTLFTKKWNNYFANNLLSGNRHTPKIALSV